MSTPAPGTHVPVLLAEVLALLEPALDGRPAVAVDATVGLGGHAEALLAAHPGLRLVGIDRDPEALAASARRLTAAFGDRAVLVRAVYDRLGDVLAELSIEAVDAVLFDLGVSSLQLDDDARGFSYARDTALDMRMDPSAPLTAADVVNGYPVERLATVLRDYGEERFARRVAAAIARRRSRGPLTSSAELADLVRTAIPAATRRTGGHPAKRTFQALRIEVNGELVALRAALPAAVDALSVGGRLVVLTYHSLEDRLVKRFFVARSTSTAPAGLPVEPASAAPVLRVLTRRPVTPGPAETAQNPRSASARLRAVEKVREAA